MKKKKCDYIGLSLIVSAVILTLVFIAACIKKKSILAAFSAVAAVNLAGCWCFLTHNRKKNGGHFFDFFDESKYEIFDKEELEHAARAIRAGFCKKHITDECGRTAKPIYEIPVDEETTEADFAK